MADKPLTSEELAAVTEYAAAHGRHWKRRLAADWMACRTEGTLHRLRNTHGPAWLKSFRLPSQGADTHHSRKDCNG